MRYALFLGCQIPARLPTFGEATRAVLAHLGLECVEIEFNCCGYPMRSLQFGAFILSAARNLALAAREGLAILTPCKCCFGTLRHAAQALREDERLRGMVEAELAAEGLRLRDEIAVRHFLTVLDEEVGAAAIRARVTRPHAGLRVAAHYGCHALRPSNVTRFDNPLAPTIFERLVAATGATPLDWPRRLECCGRPIADRNAGLAGRLIASKVADSRQAGADLVSTACPHCQLQFDSVRAGPPAEAGSGPVAAVPYPELLAAALGLPVRAPAPAMAASRSSYPAER